MGYITTYLKKHFDPVNADKNDIDILDIAHALSMLCRANGHFISFYSVAQHSLNCMFEAKARGYSKRVQLGCLLHDASEAYLSDVTRPMKARLPEYLKIEKKLQDNIFDKWIFPALTDEEIGLIFEVDDVLLYYEFLNLMDEKIIDKMPVLHSVPKFDFEDFKSVEIRFVREFNTLMEIKNGKFIGVDWMRGKWLAVELHNKTATYRTFENISAVCQMYKNSDYILIDVPIGLPESAVEAKLRPDQCARDYLNAAKRKTSVFNTPFRQMVYAKDKTEFWDMREKLGAKVSVQSYGIIKCIKDVDDFLKENHEWKNRLLESHPECAFQALNDGKGIVYSKHTKEGINERISILSKYVDNTRLLVDSVSGESKEDILDALCLAVTAKVGYKSIPDNPSFDANGLKMQILIADIK